MNSWQKGHLKVKDVHDYIDGVEGRIKYFTYDDIAYYVAPDIEMVNNGHDCWHMHLYYLPKEKRYVRLTTISAFIPELEDYEEYEPNTEACFRSCEEEHDFDFCDKCMKCDIKKLREYWAKRDIEKRKMM